MVEGNNMQLNAESEFSLPCEIIPRVFWDFSTRKVLTSEFLDGVWLTEVIGAIEKTNTTVLKEFKDSGIDLHEAAKNLLTATLHQVYVKKILHGDLHAANIVILKDNKVGLVDFGNIGTISKSFINRRT
jgi:ubiquinone biosynthesis protein